MTGWQERRNLNPLDLRLRNGGFVIYSRPKHGEAIWRLGKRLMGQTAALAWLEQEAARLKKEIEDERDNQG